MNEEIKSLIRKRGSCKARLTLFKKHLDTVTNAITNLAKNEVLNVTEIRELEYRLEKQEALLEEFRDCQTTLEISLENLDEQIQERESFENLYFKLNSECKNIISEHLDIKNRSIRSRSPSVMSVHSNSNNFGVRLPQIELPKFQGNYENWLEFRDTFTSLIHKNSQIPEISKFHYLRAQLQDDAKQVIYSLEVSKDNYAIAWQLLCDRYNNTRLLVYNHLKYLVDLSNISTGSSLEFRKMVDIIQKHLRALQSLKQPTNHWGTLLIFLLTRKLDKHTEREWEKHKRGNELPSMDEFVTFIKNKADLLETLEFNHSGSKQYFKPKVTYHKSNHSKTLNVSTGVSSNSINSNPSLEIKNIICTFCKGKHYINTCTEFLNLSIDERMRQINNRKLCINCLRGNHFVKYCRSGNCRKCKSRHHTLLHNDNQVHISDSNVVLQNQSHLETSNQSTTSGLQPNCTLSNHNVEQSSEVLLSTALIQVLDVFGHPHTCRALLDTGSQSNLITRELCDKLSLKTSGVNLAIMGIGQTISQIKDRCTVTIHSVHTNFETSISCLILPKITDYLPSKPVNLSLVNIPPHLKLADSLFNKPGPIDILLGAGLFYRLLSSGKIFLSDKQLILQNTYLGWIISGQVPSNSKMSNLLCNLNTNSNNIQEQLLKFWELEEPSSPTTIRSIEEQECEQIFTNTTYRDQDGRFVVTIPLKDSLSLLGNSKHIALERFHYLANKLARNANLNQMYSEFMSEYELLGHMSKSNESFVENNISYFLPHHGVLKESSLTTKLRVVFDASAQTDTGYSFNDIQLIGPTIQDQLLSILLRFRQHKIVVCADIEKMYRQVLVNPNQRHLQQILWRSGLPENINTYVLNTVTYGTASAPFLAIRCLTQLAIDNVNTYPKASQVIAHDFYVDDMLSGADTIENVVLLCSEVSSILKSACFNLRKWISNSDEVLENIRVTNSSTDTVQFGKTENAKTLGIYWSCKNDTLIYSIKQISFSTPITKRVILSEVSQIFDPLGLLSPCIITAKIMLQRLWLYKLSWDEILPSELSNYWQQFRNQLHHLNQMQVPRHVICTSPIRLEIHGFADSSQEAYGACAYILSSGSDGHTQVALLLSKTKVAPLKTTTIPKLELCAALILVQLVKKITTSLRLKFNDIYLWSDSTIALSWIKTSPHLLQTFVANRVTQIQSLNEPHIWRHIPTKDNPADLLSRGVAPVILQDCRLWWHGPEWLTNDKDTWPAIHSGFDGDLPELKTISKAFITVPDNVSYLIKRFSNYKRLNRVIAYCIRFSFNCKNPKSQLYGALTPTELDKAAKCLIKISQTESFPSELQCLQGGKAIDSKSNILRFNPFIDSDGIVRVGGRLQLSKFNYDKKYPMLLSSKHPLTHLLFSYEHIRLLHAGPQLMLSSIRETYWPVCGRNLAKKVVHDCVKCFRANPKQTQPIMGVLPASRVEPQSPFHNTGVDYAGYFLIKDKKGRGSKTIKCYVSLFVCFSIKAIHLELVTELTTEAFIAAFRRFIARRGRPQCVYSDNGKNFIGAQSELKELGDFINQNEQTLTETYANEGVTWKFIPAHSPHFGGLWEAGVKSCKHHLKRVMSNSLMTFEEFYTTLTQIEAILNSRPLTPLSTDPNDFDILTPAHFLIGKRLTSLPDPDIRELNENRLSRFQRAQQLQQHFWSRWSKEYISELQQRVKWKTNQLTLQEGTMVVIKEDNLPPLQWKLGRITKLHPGPDGVSRVATIQTPSGSVKRSFAKICVLPIEV